MKYDTIKGLDKKISKLIMGNDNQTDLDEASKLWDHWIEVGGNAFDNAHIYGGGSMETLLGKWHLRRDNLNDLVIIAKGAHTPNCDPKSLSKELTESHDRLQMESVDTTVDYVEAILNDFMPPESVVRIGNGSPTISSRIANVCLARGLAVQFVDETSTSIGSRYDHVSAARRICSKEGIPVTERLQVIPTEGEVREIQRRSRSISEGRLTIPSKLARAVAVGRQTLSEAVELHIRSLDR